LKIVHVVGARPNFMKLAPVHRALAGRAQQKVVHTGQHYDPNMSDVFFRQLEMPAPDVNLGVGSASTTQQTALVMTGLEPELLADRPDLVVVYGDVNSCLAAALTAVRLGIPVAHVESGLRSFDRGMPEEINRILTDRLSDLLFVPSEDGMANLRAEGIDEAKAHLVGNVMIDTVVRLLPIAEEQIRLSTQARWIGKPYALATLHRPSNVDDPARLGEVVRALEEITQLLPILLPVHPRTRARMSELGFAPDGERFVLTEPLGYLDFLALQKHASVVISDSGGVQEETTYLGVPCLTIRRNTERPVTVTIGTNKLVGDDPAQLATEVEAILRGDAKRGGIPPMWDGRAAERIADIICENGPA
jgi:UDP-N-acetylglucosamine 2-epimerase (non-hydrolysing)